MAAGRGWKRDFCLLYSDPFIAHWYSWKEQSSGFSFLQKSLKNINVIKSYGGVNKTRFGHMSFTPHFCGVNVNVAVQSGIFTLCLMCE